MSASPSMHGSAIVAADATPPDARKGGLDDEANDGRPRGRRIAGQDPAKREQIIAGAKRCFMRLGFEAASVSEIAAEAGVSKGTLYVYFEDKEALFGSLCETERTRMLSFAQQELDKAPDVEQALLRYGVVLTTKLTSDEVIRAMRMVLGVAETMPRLAARFFGNEPFSGLQVLKGYLDRQVAAGALDIADTDLAARQFIDLAMAGAFKRRLFGNMAEAPTAEYIGICVRGAVEMFLGFYRAKQPAADRG